MNMKDFRHLNFDREETQVKFKELLKNLFEQRPELMSVFGKAIDSGVRARAITAKQASVMKRLTGEVMDEVMDETIADLAEMLDVDLTEIYGG